MELNRDLSDMLRNGGTLESSCRTCLKFYGDNYHKKNIFDGNINDRIASLTSVKLSKVNGLSNFICNVCFQKLDNAIKFKKQVEETNRILVCHIKNVQVQKNQIRDSILEICKTEESSLNSNDFNNSVPDEENDDNTDTNFEGNSGSQKVKSAICPICTKKFKNSVSLRNHLRIHGGTEKKFECNQCKKKYANQYDLKVHLRKHNGARPFSCNSCKKTFADQRCFARHIKIHSGERLFKCELCDKSFIHSYTLKTHLRVHNGEKPYICAKCGHSFTTTTQLKLHTRIHHTQEKPYNCNLCSKQFASSSGLSNHKMTHTGERKFICSVCGKGSRTTSDLKCHLRTHTGERPFKCTFPDCDKKYKTNSQLCTHIRTHTGEKNYKCVTCKKSFCNTTQLKLHVCV